MQRRTRRKKGYRPKAVGRPITTRIRDELILPAYSALETVRAGTNVDGLDSARHTLAALFDYMLIALRDAGRDTATMEQGLAALLPMISRYDSGQPFRATGPEMTAIRAAVHHADQVLGTLRTDQIISAVARVNALIEAAASCDELQVVINAD